MWCCAKNKHSQVQHTFCLSKRHGGAALTARALMGGTCARRASTPAPFATLYALPARECVRLIICILAQAAGVSSALKWDIVFKYVVVKRIMGFRAA